MATRFREQSGSWYVPCWICLPADYSLIGPPVLSKTGILLHFAGQIYASNSVVKKCRHSPLPMPALQQRQLRIYIDGTLLQCYIEALQTTGSLESLTNTGLQNLLGLDKSRLFDLLKLTNVQGWSYTLTLTTVIRWMYPPTHCMEFWHSNWLQKRMQWKNL